MENGENSEGPAPAGPVQHGLREESRCEGGDEVWRGDVREDKSSILQLRCVGKDDTQDIVAVDTTVIRMLTNDYNTRAFLSTHPA